MPHGPDTPTSASLPPDLPPTLHDPLLLLRILAYAADAMRVLRQLELHAGIAPHLDTTLRSMCPDWRNPGSIDDPADLIAMGLNLAIQTLTDALRQAQAQPSPPAPG